ncbi:U3 small nucleolar ribonucleoprotein protein IMP4-like [Phasianus colchicus]|uniref:U3 small nucleolar ribonucleoprotein protein IMP4-like n=1 Tax=Phasianus colchicus TaxID=9054 RepID=UPI00129D6152|nr:U3 small nucleolar ribonucleoprotein protein IMP4-like [Phasianus colchicus]
MLRRQARERREYLQRRAQEERLRRQQDKKEQLRQALDENRLLPTELRRQALALQKELEFETPGENGVTGSQDDEYRWAGLELPKVMVTTSRDPSSRLRVFAKVGDASVVGKAHGMESGFGNMGGALGWLCPQSLCFVL